MARVCPLALQPKVYQLLNKESVKSFRDVLFVSELQYGATNVDQSPSKFLTSTKYSQAEQRCSKAHVYYSIGKYEITSVISHIL